MEYWYQKLNFIDREDIYPSQSGGGIGLGIGGGFEFPIVMREYYLGIEFLYHTVSFFDKNTRDYQACDSSGSCQAPNETYDDLEGNVLSFMASYIINW